MNFMVGVLFAFFLLAVIVLGVIVSVIYVNWLLLGLFVLSCIGLMQVVKYCCK
jgi:hypothetical protein